MQDISDVFKGGTESMDRVIILPSGSYGAGPYTSQSDIPWNEFESIEIVTTTDGGETAGGSSTISPLTTSAKPTSWGVSIPSLSSAGAVRGLTITATGDNTFSVSGVVSTTTLKSIIGYKRKLSTRNSSKTIMVNGGANIGTSYTESINIATAFGTEYVGKDLQITCEIYHEGHWGDPKFIFLYDAGGYGVGATLSKEEGIIYVSSGSARISSARPNCGNSFNNDATSAPCRVTVSLTEEAFPATKSSGGKEWIWSEPLGTTGDIDFSGTGKTFSQYDSIIVGIRHAQGGFEWEEIVSSDLLLNPPSGVILIGGGSDANYLRSVTATDTSLSLLAYNAKITSLKGINYN